MLTRLEVHGFKNLVDVQVEFGAFTCIAGANGVGKSNVFDAIEFLSHLASEPFVDAARRVRGPSGERGGDPRDLFWDGYREHERAMRLVAEMIVPREVDDDLGETVVTPSTFLRYALKLQCLVRRRADPPGRAARDAELATAGPGAVGTARAGQLFRSTSARRGWPTPGRHAVPDRQQR